MTSGSTTSTSGAVNRGSGAHEPSYTGRAVRRFEDADLLRGHGRFGDDLPVRPDTLHAAILRSSPSVIDAGLQAAWSPA